MTEPAETARGLLWRHQLPEDVIDGALALHAQELDAKVRSTDLPDWVESLDTFDNGASWAADLINPAVPDALAGTANAEAYRTDPAVSAVPAPAADQADAIASCPGQELDPNLCRCPCYGCKHHCAAHNPDDTDLTEADIDRLMAAGTPVQIVTGPPTTYGAVAATDQAAPSRRAACPNREPLLGVQCTKEPGHEVHSDRPGRIWYPMPADRAAVLREAADGFDRHAEQLLDGIGGKAVFVAKALRDQAALWSEAAETLRRMAAESAPADTGHASGETWDVPDARPGTTDHTLLRLSEEICPGFPDRCPNLRTVEPEPDVHLGGVRCGCADEQPAAAQQSKEADRDRPRCPRCQLPHDLTPDSMGDRACKSILASLADAGRRHDAGDHSRCARVDCEVVRARADEEQQMKEADNPRTVCVCGHTRGEHARVSGRLLCDECDPESTDNLTCEGFEAL